jgi:hypothetical protein
MPTYRLRFISESLQLLFEFVPRLLKIGAFKHFTPIFDHLVHVYRIVIACIWPYLVYTAFELLLIWKLPQPRAALCFFTGSRTYPQIRELYIVQNASPMVLPLRHISFRR